MRRSRKLLFDLFKETMILAHCSNPIESSYVAAVTTYDPRLSTQTKRSYGLHGNNPPSLHLLSKPLPELLTGFLPLPTLNRNNDHDYSYICICGPPLRNDQGFSLSAVLKVTNEGRSTPEYVAAVQAVPPDLADVTLAVQENGRVNKAWILQLCPR